MEVGRETFQKLPPQEQILVMFDVVQGIPEAICKKMDNRYVPKENCPVCSKTPSDPSSLPPFQFTVKNVVGGLLGLGLMFGALWGLVHGGSNQVQPRPAISAPATVQNGGPQ